MTITPPPIDWGPLVPAIILAGGAMALLLLGTAGRSARHSFAPLSIIVLLAAGAAAARLWGRGGPAFAGMITGDDLALFAILIFVLSAGLTILHSVGGPIYRKTGPDYYPVLLLATAGMSLLAASTDLVTILLSLEVLSISLYVIIGMNRQSPGATEAALKYFLLGAFASAFAIYGTALIYGGLGTTSLAAIALGGSDFTSGHPLVAFIGLALLTVGLGFKISMVPFHAWTPDVYQGAPTPLTAFLSTGSKAAVFVVVLRLFDGPLTRLGHPIWQALADEPDWPMMLAVLAILTMTVGNITALRQWDLKRLLAFSSVAHVGYLLVGVVAGRTDGASGVLFYLLGYTAMNLTAFGVIGRMERKETGSATLDDCAGLAHRRPALAAAMAVALFSLAGVPPTVGFVGKFYLFRAAVRADFAWLVVVAVLNSVVSLYYYLRIVVYMYMKPAEAEAPPARLHAAGAVALVISVVIILALGVFPGFFLRLAQTAAGLFG